MNNEQINEALEKNLTVALRRSDEEVSIGRISVVIGAMDPQAPFGNPTTQDGVPYVIVWTPIDEGNMGATIDPDLLQKIWIVREQ